MDTTTIDKAMSDVDSFVTANAEEQTAGDGVNGVAKPDGSGIPGPSADMSDSADERGKDSPNDVGETRSDKQDPGSVKVNQDQSDDANDNGAKGAEATGGAEVNGENNLDMNGDAAIDTAASEEPVEDKMAADVKTASKAKAKATGKPKKGKSASASNRPDEGDEVEEKSAVGDESDESEESGTKDATPAEDKKDAKDVEQSTAAPLPPFIMPITKTEMLAFLDKHDGNETCRNVKECIAIARKMVEKQPEGAIDVKTMLARLDQWAVGAHPNKLTNIEIARVVIGRMEAEKAKEAEKAADKSEATPTKRKRQSKVKKGEVEQDGDEDGEEGTPAKKAKTPTKSKGGATPKKGKKVAEKVESEEGEDED